MMFCPAKTLSLLTPIALATWTACTLPAPSGEDDTDVRTVAVTGAPGECDSSTGRCNPPPRPLVAIGDKNSRIKWLPPVMSGEEPEVVITVKGLAPPLILPDLVERVGTVQAYLAVADTSQPLPPALLPFVREDDRLVMNDPEKRRALRDENQRLLRELERELAATGGQPGTASTCSQAQKE